MDGVTLREAQREEFEKIVDFVNSHFVPFEPINKASNLCEEGYRMPYFDAWCRIRLEREGSINIVAVDHSDQILGVALAVVLSSEHEELEPELDCADRSSRVPRRFKVIKDFLGWFEEQAIHEGVLDKSLESQTRVDYVIVTGSSVRRVQGLGTELARKIRDTGRERGIQHQTVITTSAYSARIFEKLGFIEVFAYPFNQYKVDGNVVFETEDPHTHAKFFLLNEQ